MTTLDKTVSILMDLVSYPSVSTESNLEIINYLANKIKDCGGSVNLMSSEDGSQANLFGTIGPEINGGIVLSGHTDVVPAKELKITVIVVIIKDLKRLNLIYSSIINFIFINIIYCSIISLYTINTNIPRFYGKIF